MKKYVEPHFSVVKCDDVIMVSNIDVYLTNDNDIVDTLSFNE